jgi:anaerobic dimethyl sulfoxide reductase subunit C (anchor subunit)
METREFALIAFTILAQMSVGSFLVLLVVRFFAVSKAGEKQADELADRALYAIGPVLVLGLAASLLHLGNPLNAYKAVTNFSTSWLSRRSFWRAVRSCGRSVCADAVAQDFDDQRAQHSRWHRR